MTRRGMRGSVRADAIALVLRAYWRASASGASSVRRAESTGAGPADDSRERRSAPQGAVVGLAEQCDVLSRAQCAKGIAEVEVELGLLDRVAGKVVGRWRSRQTRQNTTTTNIRGNTRYRPYAGLRRCRCAPPAPPRRCSAPECLRWRHRFPPDR